ncbi:hypothetical protein DVA67_003690 [Solirubrobacter sp. CPCC 204708]|uniref:Uncharacterized protein n=1 Tax=Solirubrobacter deserti TaxID=2282478 RepID=A0ABT4RTJ9_9ACTN|nr:hypothetical protein [Solirubrobacter deserti]MBE2315063.1 hypothetical protein [Solirubrobacter deserti]MDA0141904.1 hypothetical protein [Solirubrobacter deserti]
MRAGQALGLGAWLLIIAWLVLYVTDRSRAAGWCLLGAGVLLLVAGPLFLHTGDRQLRITGVVMLAAGAFFAAFGLYLAT